MTAAEIRELAALTAKLTAGELRPLLQVAELPAQVGVLVADAARHGDWQSIQWHQFGSLGFEVELRLNPDGAIRLRLNDMSGAPLWEHMLRPPAEVPGADG